MCKAMMIDKSNHKLVMTAINVAEATWIGCDP